MTHYRYFEEFDFHSFKETVPVLEEHEEALKQKLQQALMVTQKQT